MIYAIYTDQYGAVLPELCNASLDPRYATIPKVIPKSSHFSESACGFSIHA